MSKYLLGSVMITIITLSILFISIIIGVTKLYIKIYAPDNTDNTDNKSEPEKEIQTRISQWKYDDSKSFSENMKNKSICAHLDKRDSLNRKLLEKERVANQEFEKLKNMIIEAAESGQTSITLDYSNSLEMSNTLENLIKDSGLKLITDYGSPTVRWCNSLNISKRDGKYYSTAEDILSKDMNEALE